MRWYSWLGCRRIRAGPDGAHYPDAVPTGHQLEASGAVAGYAGYAIDHARSIPAVAGGCVATAVASGRFRLRAADAAAAGQPPVAHSRRAPSAPERCVHRHHRSDQYGDQEANGRVLEPELSGQPG